MDKHLVEAVMKRWKIRDRKIAEERARIIGAYLESRGLLSKKKGLEECFGRKYSAEGMVRHYEENILRPYRKAKVL